MAQIENNFIVALEGVKLTDSQKQKINSGIQEIVMRELAQIDHSEMVVKKNKTNESNIFNRPFIWGIRIKLNESILNIERQSPIAR